MVIWMMTAQEIISRFRDSMRSSMYLKWKSLWSLSYALYISIMPFSAYQTMCDCFSSRCVIRKAQKASMDEPLTHMQELFMLEMTSP